MILSVLYKLTNKKYKLTVGKQTEDQNERYG